MKRGEGEVMGLCLHVIMSVGVSYGMHARARAHMSVCMHVHACAHVHMCKHVEVKG